MISCACRIGRVIGPLLLVSVAALVLIFLWGPRAQGTERNASLPLDEHLRRDYRDDLPGLLERRYIRVLTTLNRTNFFLSGGKPFGFEYALLRDYEKFLNRNHKGKGLNVVLEFIPVSRDELIPKLVDGYGDIAAAGLTITPRRKARVDFTEPYLTGVSEVVVTPKGGFAPRSPEDLSGKTVFIRESSSYYESVRALNKRLARAGKEPVKVVKAEEDLETEDILEMVNSGAVPVTIADDHIARIWSGIFSDLQVHYQVRLRTGGEIAWMVRRSNPRLKASLNRFLKTRRKGTLYGNIYFNRYYKDNPWIKNPLAGRQREKLNEYKDLFQKYARRYGFDWLLIAAMAYQESGLDHGKKNRSGAVGILQVLPRTATSKHVGIPDVHRLENNVHAGVKYLAFIRDRYFHEESMRLRDRVRFSLAAYNAGPARIRQCRSLAARMGLDRDRWFRNVEMAALKKVGREPVRYVSNINKYYVIYRHSVADEPGLFAARENGGRPPLAAASR